MSGSEERVFPASRSRRQSLRRRGDVASPSWLQEGLPVVVWLWMLGSFGAKWFEQFQLVLSEELRITTSMSWNAQLAWQRGMTGLVRLASVIWPMVVIPWVACVGLRLLQTRLLVSWEAVRPDLGRLSLVAGFRRFGATRAMGNLGRTFLQCLIASGICLLVGWEMCMPGPCGTSWGAGAGAVQAVLGQGIRPIRLLCSCLLLVGLADLVWQWVAYERRIRMTAEEVREELRNSERRSKGTTGAGHQTTEVHPAPGH